MFDCLFDVCPEDPKKCHLFWEMPWENTETGEQTIRKGCILSQRMGLPIVQAIVRAAHTSSEHATQARNSTENLHQTMGQLAALAQDAAERRAIEDE